MNDTGTVHAQAQEIVPELLYEVQQFSNAARRYEQLEASRADLQLQEMLLEVALLHARNLYFFFFVRPATDKPDVSARHFLPSWPSFARPTELCPYLKENEEQLPRALAHLSFERIKYRVRKSWNLTRIATELANVWAKFHQSLPLEIRLWLCDESDQLRAAVHVPINIAEARTGESTWSVSGSIHM